MDVDLLNAGSSRQGPDTLTHDSVYSIDRGQVRVMPSMRDQDKLLLRRFDAVEISLCNVCHRHAPPLFAQLLEEGGLVKRLGGRESDCARWGDLGVDAIALPQAGSTDTFGWQPYRETVAPFSQ